MKYIVGSLLLFTLFISCRTYKEITVKDDFNIETKAECIKKHGYPDFTFKDICKYECLAYYDSTKAINYICFDEKDICHKSGWLKEFKSPDTTELIENRKESRQIQFYEKAFNLKEMKNGDFYIFILPALYNEQVIIFNINDSLGNYMIANEKIGNQIYDKDKNHKGRDSLKVKDFYWTKGYYEELINIKSLRDSLQKYPVDEIGSILKKGVCFVDGTYLSIKSMKNGKIYYSTFDFVPWYDKRYDVIYNEIIKIINNNK